VQREPQSDEENEAEDMQGQAGIEWEEDEGDEAEESEEAESYSEDYTRDAGRFLDDELGVDTPVQVERRERIVEGMKFEDIVPGIQLRVSSNSTDKYAHIMYTLGRIGIVVGILSLLPRFSSGSTSSCSNLGALAKIPKSTHCVCC